MNTDTAEKRDKNITTSDRGVIVEGHGLYVHSVPAYLKQMGLSLEDYQRKYPAATLFSDVYMKKKREKESELVSAAAMVVAMPGSETKAEFGKLFDLGNHPSTMNSRGEPVMCAVLGEPDQDLKDFVPAVDNNYIYPIDNLKAIMVATALNMPCLVWGMHGTGKTTLIEQFFARTNRPSIRVQHTVSTEEAHILGHYVVKSRVIAGKKAERDKDGNPIGVDQPDTIVSETVFEPGPLALAMRRGIAYLADEYDFALPSVTSVYQPVLEGKPLIIKEAPPEWRVVKPHKNFRFYATGNTNGNGDEVGLYTGTQVMNAANYSRFGVTVQMEYMPDTQETAVVIAQGRLHKDDASLLVKVAGEIRAGFASHKLSTTISPRELINAARLARSLGKEPNIKLGLQLAYVNRLNSVDKKAVEDYIQRIIK